MSMVRLGCACAIIWWASGNVRADLVLPVIGTGSVVNTSLNEISGLAYSPTGTGMLWAIEDSGNPARLFKLGTNGALNGSYDLPSPITNRDWEDIAFANGYVHVGEIGDNNAAYLSVKVHRVLESVIDNGITSGEVQTLTLHYPGSGSGHHAVNAETLMVSPDGNTIYIATKELNQSRIFSLSPDWNSTSPQTMSLLATITGAQAPGISGVTGGDIAPDGSGFILRSSSVAQHGGSNTAWYWSLVGMTIEQALMQTPTVYDLQSEPQGESITFSTDGTLYAVSEYSSSVHGTGSSMAIPLYHHANPASVPEAHALWSCGISAAFVAAMSFVGCWGRRLRGGE